MLLGRTTVTSLVLFNGKDVFDDAAVRPVVITYAHGLLDQEKIYIRSVSQSNEFPTVTEIPHELYKTTYKNVFDLSLEVK